MGGHNRMETIKEKIKQGKGKEENAVEQEVGKVPRQIILEPF